MKTCKLDVSSAFKRPYQAYLNESSPLIYTVVRLFLSSENVPGDLFSSGM